jgi:hypothetical protein
MEHSMVLGLASAFAILILIVAIVLLLALGFVKRLRMGFVPRPIAAFSMLKRAIGLAVEDGKRLHISLGKSSLTSSEAAAGLAALSTLERIAQLSMASDRPPIATSGDSGMAILSQDALRAAYRNSNVLDQYDPDRGRLTGLTPFSYIAGALPVMEREQASAHLLVGNFGPEVALLTDAADRQRAFTLTASDSLPAQAVLYATAQEPLIGEEMYAIPAYLQSGPFHTASLHAQDALRWLVGAVIVLGAVLKLMGVNLL